jgi:hypothetical protein
MSSTFLHLKFPPDVPNHHLTSIIQPSFPTQILSSTSPTSHIHIHIHIEQQTHTVYLESTQLDATINLHNELPYTTIHYQKTTLSKDDAWVFIKPRKKSTRRSNPNSKETLCIRHGFVLRSMHVYESSS